MGQHPSRRSFVGSGRAAPYHKDRREAVRPTPVPLRPPQGSRAPRRVGDVFAHRLLRDPIDSSRAARMVIVRVESDRYLINYCGEAGDEQYPRSIARTTFEETYR